MEEGSFLIETLKRGLFIGLIFFFVLGMLIITSMFKQALLAHDRLWQFLGVARHPLRPAIIVLAAALAVVVAGFLLPDPWVSGFGFFLACWSALLYRTRPRPDIFEERRDRS